MECHYVSYLVSSPDPTYEWGLGTRLLCTEKQARASKYINPLMPPAAVYIHSADLFLCIFVVPKQVRVYDKTASNLCCICLDTQPC